MTQEQTSIEGRAMDTGSHEHEQSGDIGGDSMSPASVGAVKKTFGGLRKAANIVLGIFRLTEKLSSLSAAVGKQNDSIQALTLREVKSEENINYLFRDQKRIERTVEKQEKQIRKVSRVRESVARIETSQNHIAGTLARQDRLIENLSERVSQLELDAARTGSRVYFPEPDASRERSQPPVHGMDDRRTVISVAQRPSASLTIEPSRTVASSVNGILGHSPYEGGVLDLSFMHIERSADDEAIEELLAQQEDEESRGGMAR